MAADKTPTLPSPCPPTNGDAAAGFEPLLDAARATHLLGGMHIKTLQRLARHGVVPAYQIGRFWYFRASELNRWLVTMCEANPLRGQEKRGTKCPRG